jgi:hypothetical protein
MVKAALWQAHEHGGKYHHVATVLADYLGYVQFIVWFLHTATVDDLARRPLTATTRVVRLRLTPV